MDSASSLDRYKLVYLTLILYGIGVLIAWNMFIMAKDYFVQFKLVNAGAYAEDFLVYLGFACQIPNFMFSWFNVFVRISSNLRTRIIYSLIAEMLIFVVTIILAMIDSSDWPVLFFWLTLISVFILNGFNQIFQNSVFGIAAKLPQKYSGAFILGNNVCGTLVALLSWVTDSLGHSFRTAAIYYFLTGLIVLMICFDTYIALPINKFFRYYNTSSGQELHTESGNIPYKTIVKQAWVQLYNIFITLFLSLAIFPSIHSDISAVSQGFLGNNFVRITCFITFNTAAMIGNLTAIFCQYPRPRWLVIFTTIRLLFIPFYLFCNYHPLGRQRKLPVLIHSDWVYWIGAVLFGWSSGHGSSLGMMYVCGTVAPEHAVATGMIGGATFMTGIISGIVFSRLGPVFVT